MVAAERRSPLGVFAARRRQTAPRKRRKKSAPTAVPALPKHERRAITEDEWRKLLRAARAAGSKILALLVLLYDACLRAGEVEKVTLEHCKYLHRRQFYTPRSKGGRAGWFTLDPVTVAAVSAWIDEKYPDRATRTPELPVFTTRRKIGSGDRPMSRHSVYRIIETLGERAQIPRAIAHPHAIRHGFIMHYLKLAHAAGLVYEQMIPTLAPRVGHTTAHTILVNYLSETVGAQKVMRELTAKMLSDDEE